MGKDDGVIEESESFKDFKSRCFDVNEGRFNRNFEDIFEELKDYLFGFLNSGGQRTTLKPIDGAEMPQQVKESFYTESNAIEVGDAIHIFKHKGVYFELSLYGGSLDYGDTDVNGVLGNLNVVEKKIKTVTVFE